MAFERALAIWQVQPNGMLAPLDADPSRARRAQRPDPRTGSTTWWRHHPDERAVRGLRRPGSTGRRDGAGHPPGRARRRYAGDGLRQAASRPLRFPPRIARGRRALGALHLPGYRASRGLSLPGACLRPLDCRRRLDVRRRPTWPHSSTSAASCGSTRRWSCRGCRDSPAARSATSATTSCARSSRFPTPRGTTGSCPTPSSWWQTRCWCSTTSTTGRR